MVVALCGTVRGGSQPASGKFPICRPATSAVRVGPQCGPNLGSGRRRAEHLNSCARGSWRWSRRSRWRLISDSGQPMEHGMRACIISMRLRRRLGLDTAARDDVYWVSLLAMVGCTADSYELRQIFGDDLALRAGMFEAGPSERAIAGYFLSRAGSDGGPVRRAHVGARLLTTGDAGGRRVADDALHGHRPAGRATQLRCRRARSAPAHLRALGRQGRAARSLGRCDRARGPRRRRGELRRGRAPPPGRGGGGRVRSQILGIVAGPAGRRCLVGGADEILDGMDEHSWDAVVAGEPGSRSRLPAPSSTRRSQRWGSSPI